MYARATSCLPSPPGPSAFPFRPRSSSRAGDKRRREVDARSNYLVRGRQPFRDTPPPLPVCPGAAGLVPIPCLLALRKARHGQLAPVDEEPLRYGPGEKEKPHSLFADLHPRAPRVRSVVPPSRKCRSASAGRPRAEKLSAVARWTLGSICFGAARRAFSNCSRADS